MRVLHEAKESARGRVNWRESATATVAALVASIYAVGVHRKWRRIYDKKEKQQQQLSKGRNNNKQNECKKI